MNFCYKQDTYIGQSYVKNVKSPRKMSIFFSETFLLLQKKMKYYFLFFLPYWIAGKAAAQFLEDFAVNF